MVARQPSSGISSSGAGGVKLPPALATRMSTGPRPSSIWPRIASMSLDLVTSPVTPMALPPLSRIPADTLAGCGVAAVDGDRGAAAGELSGDGLTDTPGAAGYQGGAAVQGAHVRSPWPCG